MAGNRESGVRLSALGPLGVAFKLGAQMLWFRLDFGRIRALISGADALNEASFASYEG